MGIFSIFKAIGRWAKRAFGLAQMAGLSDDLIQKALELVRHAATEFSHNDIRREWVVKSLMAAGVKESIARLAVELAIQLFKQGKETAPPADPAEPAPNVTDGRSW